MSKLTEQLREIKVFNPHHFYEHGQVHVDYYPTVGVRTDHWAVVQEGFTTDPDRYQARAVRIIGGASVPDVGPWSANGNMTFSGYRARPDETRRAAGLRLAQEWAAERYGITEWKRDPFGSYGSAEYVSARLAELKQQLKER